MLTIYVPMAKSKKLKPFHKLSATQWAIIMRLESSHMGEPWKKQSLSKVVALDLGVERDASFRASYSRSLRRMKERKLITVIDNHVFLTLHHPELKEKGMRSSFTHNNPSRMVREKKNEKSILEHLKKIETTRKPIKK